MVGEILVSFRHTMVYKNEQRKRETNTFTEKEGHVDVSGRPALLSSPFKAEGRAKFFLLNRMWLHHFLFLKCRFHHWDHVAMQLFLCNLVNGRFGRRFVILALQGRRVTAGTQRPVSRLGVVVRVASRVVRLVAALAGMRALAVAPRWPKQTLQRGRRVLRRAFGVTQQGGAMMIGVR